MFPSLSVDTIQQIFNSDEWPRILTIRSTDSGYIMDLFINQNIHWLQGHFPEQPLVAGVVQTHWATKLAQQIFTITEDIQQIDNLKFQNVILPEQTIQLSVEFNAAKNAVKFCYSKKTDQDQTETVFSEGKLNFYCKYNDTEKLS